MTTACHNNPDYEVLQTASVTEWLACFDSLT